MIQHTSESADKGKKKKLIILIVGIVVLALALSALGAFWYVKQTERTKAARKQCEVKVAQVMKAKKTWDALVKNRILIKLSEDKSENGKKLAKIIKETTPEVVSCTANSPEELGSQSAEALAASEWYAVKAKEIRALAVELLNSADTKAEDKDKKEEKKEEKKEIQRTTSNVIRRANVIPQKTKPAPQNNNKKDPKKPECKGKDCKKPADPNAKPADPNAKPADPNAKPADPNAKPADPNAKPADPNAKPADPNAKPADPNAKPADPNAKPADPNAKPADPNAKPADPNAKPADPNAKPADPPATPHQ